MDGVRDWLKYQGFALFGLGWFDIGPRHVFGPLGILYPWVNGYGDYRNIPVRTGQGFPQLETHG
jgi:hypothetical protein